MNTATTIIIIAIPTMTAAMNMTPTMLRCKCRLFRTSHRGPVSLGLGSQAAGNPLPALSHARECPCAAHHINVSSDCLLNLGRAAGNPAVLPTSREEQVWVPELNQAGRTRYCRSSNLDTSASGICNPGSTKRSSSSRRRRSRMMASL